jgi:hypothetical protein
MKNFFKCLNCKRIFAQSELTMSQTSYENYYGVGDLFPQTHHTLTVYACPHCGNEALEEAYVPTCDSCNNYTKVSYEFFGKTFCFNCALEYIPETELILEDFIGEDYPQLINLFKELTKPLKYNLFEVIKTLSKEYKFFFQDYLYYLEELYKNFSFGKDLDDVVYFNMCYDCIRSKYCHEECIYCDDYLEHLEKLEAIEVVLNKYPFLRKEV